MYIIQINLQLFSLALDFSDDDIRPSLPKSDTETSLDTVNNGELFVTEFIEALAGEPCIPTVSSPRPPPSS